MHSVAHLIKAYYAYGYQDELFVRRSAKTDFNFTEGFSLGELFHKSFYQIKNQADVDISKCRFVVHPKVAAHLSLSEDFKPYLYGQYRAFGAIVEVDYECPQDLMICASVVNSHCYTDMVGAFMGYSAITQLSGEGYPCSYYERLVEREWEKLGLEEETIVGMDDMPEFRG